MTKNYFCHDIHSGLFVRWSPHGWKAAPCCFTSSSSKIIDINRKDWFNNLWPALRKDNINNKELDYNFCKSCIDDEKIGKQSRRIGELIKRGEKKEHKSSLKYLEITIDYTCNQACMICNVDASSLWRKYTEEKITTNSPLANKENIEDFFKNIDLKNLDTIKIMGGEPLITERHTELLLFLEKKGCDLSKIELKYHTNGSCRVGKNVLDLWKKFKLVLLYFSIDDIRAAFEYQRYPGNWTQLIENMNWFKNEVSPNVLLRIERTASLLNAHRLLELENWKEKNYNLTKFNYMIEFNTHMAHDTMLKIENISKKHLDFLKKDKKNYEALSRFYPINQLIINEEKKSKVLEFINEQDQKRNISISSYFPEFYSLYQ
jgi:MoaA/NifB/PqqE/SkfB family radical SAM enzyme